MAPDANASAATRSFATVVLDGRPVPVINSAHARRRARERTGMDADPLGDAVLTDLLRGGGASILAKYWRLAGQLGEQRLAIRHLVLNCTSVYVLTRRRAGMIVVATILPGAQVDLAAVRGEFRIHGVFRVLSARRVTFVPLVQLPDRHRSALQGWSQK